MSSPFLGLAAASLDRRYAPAQHLLVGFEICAAWTGDDLALAALDQRQLHIFAEVFLLDHVRHHAEHRDQFRHVYKLRKARDRLVETAGLQLQIGPGVAKVRAQESNSLRPRSSSIPGDMNRCRVYISPIVLVIGVPLDRISGRLAASG